MSPRARRDVRRRSRAVEKAKKLRTFARESRRFASRRRAPGTRRVREISLGFYESRDFFTRDEIHALTPSRPSSRAASLESSWVRDSRIRRTRRVRLFSTAELARKRFRAETVSALGLRSDAFTIRTIRTIRKIFRFRRWKTETRERRRLDVLFRRQGLVRNRKRKSLLLRLRSDSTRFRKRRKRQKSIHATLSKMNVPPAPFARPMSVSSSRYVT